MCYREVPTTFGWVGRRNTTLPLPWIHWDTTMSGEPVNDEVETPDGVLITSRGGSTGVDSDFLTDQEVGPPTYRKD